MQSAHSGNSQTETGTDRYPDEDAERRAELERAERVYWQQELQWDKLS